MTVYQKDFWIYQKLLVSRPDFRSPQEQESLEKASNRYPKTGVHARMHADRDYDPVPRPPHTNQVGFLALFY